MVFVHVTIYLSPCRNTPRSCRCLIHQSPRQQTSDHPAPGDSGNIPAQVMRKSEFMCRNKAEIQSNVSPQCQSYCADGSQGPHHASGWFEGYKPLQSANGCCHQIHQPADIHVDYCNVAIISFSLESIISTKCECSYMSLCVILTAYTRSPQAMIPRPLRAFIMGAMRLH